MYFFKLINNYSTITILDNELGLSTDEQEICALLMNKQDNGMIAFEDFREWFMNNKNYLQIITDPTKHDILVHAVVYFRKYDHDASDGLDVEQFGELLSEHGYTPVQVQNEFDRVDLNKNGIVSFYEFLKWLKWIDI